MSRCRYLKQKRRRRVQQEEAWNQTGDFDLPPDFAVTQNEIVKLRVKVDSPIEGSKLQWSPSLFYTAVTGPAHRLPNVKVQDKAGNYLIQLDPPYDIDLYPDTNLTSPQAAYVASQTGTLARLLRHAAREPTPRFRSAAGLLLTGFSAARTVLLYPKVFERESISGPARCTCSFLVFPWPALP